MDTRIAAAGEAPITHAARLLHGGELVAFPTGTVYGLGGDAAVLGVRTAITF
jgi:tRNA A37 threonylcarbamoyladenosine synthetase subunit TsaC/SUA5/YrdC